MSQMQNPLLQISNLNFSYKNSGRIHKILDNFSLSVAPGEYLAIKGPSGSGKSTLFYLVGCLLRADSGKILFKDKKVHEMNDEQLCRFRNENMGFVFQQFHLLPRANVIDNILLPANYPAESSDKRDLLKPRAEELAKRLGLGEYLYQAPNQLSGGQQQRVAIARALLQDVDLILADEPTGNLDTKSAAEVLKIFDELHAQGKSIIMITHDDSVAQRADRIIEFQDGVIRKEVRNRSTVFSKPVSTIEDKADFASKNEHKTQQSTHSSRTLSYLRRSLPIVVANLKRNKKKSFLTMSGVVIGVAAVLAMMSLGEFAKKKILEGYEAIGVNQVQFSGYAEWGRRRSRVSTKSTAADRFFGFKPEKDLKALYALMPEFAAISPMIYFREMQISYGGLGNPEKKYAIRGVSEEYAVIQRIKMQLGRFLTEHDVNASARVCVVGPQIIKDLGITPDQIVGDTLMTSDQSVYSFSCRVIGVIAGGMQQSSPAFKEVKDKIFVPHSTLTKIALPWDGPIWNVVADLRNNEKMDVIEQKLKDYFTQKYADTIEFNFDQNIALVHQMRRFLAIFTYLLAAIACLSLLVGGIGIHNMMLVSVVDRLKEIGLRKALGASQKSIGFLFLLESVVLCSIAGVIGLFLGLGFCQVAVYLASHFIKDLKYEWIMDPVAILVSIGSVILVGVMSGMVPASKAEKLPIIEALRSE